MVRVQELIEGNLTAQFASAIEQLQLDSSEKGNGLLDLLCICCVAKECTDCCVKSNCCDNCCGCCDGRRRSPPPRRPPVYNNCEKNGLDEHGRPCDRFRSAFLQEFSDAELAAPIQLRIEDWASRAAAGGGALLEEEAHMRSDYSFFFKDPKAEELKKWGAWLMEQKFGTPSADARACMDGTVEALEKLVPEEEPGRVKAMFEQVPNVFFYNVMNASARLAAAYAPFVAAHGLDLTSKGMPNFSSCGRLVCGGDLKYKLTTAGLHECLWQCPTGQRPDKFKMVQAVTVATMPEEKRKKIEEEMKSASKLRQFASVASFVNNIHYNWAKAFSDAPLRLWQQADLYNASGTLASAFRFEGACRTTDLMVGDRVVRKADGEVGKVTKLAGTHGLVFKTVIPEGSVEVEYKSGTMVQFVSALAAPYDVVSVPVPKDYVAWAIASNASELALKLPALAEVPEDQSMMIWASAPPPRPVEEPPLRELPVVGPVVTKDQLQSVADQTLSGQKVTSLAQGEAAAVPVVSAHREKLD